MINPHADCKYFGFKKLETWCRHPKHPRQLTIGFCLPCADHVHLSDVKVFDGQPITWEKPVELNQQACHGIATRRREESITETAQAEIN